MSKEELDHIANGGKMIEQPAQQEPDVYGYASRLATNIWKKHYIKDAPQWRPFDDLIGVLTQIDNMTTGLTRIEQPAQQEPVDSTQISKVWWDGEKLMAKPIPFVEFYKPAQQEPVLQEIEQYRLQMAGISTAAIGYWKESDGIHPDYDTIALRDVAKLYAKYDELYMAQRTWVGLTHEEHMEIMTGTMTTSSRMAAVEAKLKEKNNG